MSVSNERARGTSEMLIPTLRGEARITRLPAVGGNLQAQRIND